MGWPRGPVFSRPSRSVVAYGDHVDAGSGPYRRRALCFMCSSNAGTQLPRAVNLLISNDAEHFPLMQTWDGWIPSDLAIRGPLFFLFSFASCPARTVSISSRHRRAEKTRAAVYRGLRDSSLAAKVSGQRLLPTRRLPPRRIHAFHL